MDGINIVSVSGGDLLAVVEDLAGRIWREHYVPIIGRPQVEYMLEKFQSRAAILNQIQTEGFLYYLLQAWTRHWVGYTAVIPKSSELFLSKLYIAAEHRGQGYGARAVSFIEAVAGDQGLPVISLTVNKKNTGSIQAYRRFGFKITGSFVMDIGGGFIMDDYRMEKAL